MTRIFEAPGAYRTTILLVCVLLSFFASWQRNTVWFNDVLIWEDVVENGTSKSRALNSLGMAYYNAGQKEKALMALYRAVDLNPDSGLAYGNLGTFFFDKALAEGDPKTLDKAIEYFQYSDALRPGDAVTRGYLEKAAHYRKELSAARGLDRVH